MSDAERRSWTWHFKSPPAAIWPLLADTARFNEAAGLPRHRITEIPQADGSVRPEARMDMSAVVDTFMTMARLPLSANILFTTVMATKMPYVGRG